MCWSKLGSVERAYEAFGYQKLLGMQRPVKCTFACPCRIILQVLATFSKFNADIVAGTECCRYPNAGRLDEWYAHHQQPANPDRPHLNAGFVMGTTARLIEAYRFVQSEPDDQVALAQYFCRYVVTRQGCNTSQIRIVTQVTRVKVSGVTAYAARCMVLHTLALCILETFTNASWIPMRMVL